MPLQPGLIGAALTNGFDVVSNAANVQVAHRQVALVVWPRRGSASAPR